jgi:hypothetical protein
VFLTGEEEKQPYYDYEEDEILSNIAYCKSQIAIWNKYLEQAEKDLEEYRDQE